MNPEAVLRSTIARELDSARAFVGSFTGLYADEDLVGVVLAACDRAAGAQGRASVVVQARRAVDQRCTLLATVADRFGERDPVRIARARAKTIAAVDRFQDVVFEARRVAELPPPPAGLLRRKSR
jgi:hypothetical protein